jgi:hypothetical protein
MPLPKRIGVQDPLAVSPNWIVGRHILDLLTNR